MLRYIARCGECGWVRAVSSELRMIECIRGHVLESGHQVFPKTLSKTIDTVDLAELRYLLDDFEATVSERERYREENKGSVYYDDAMIEYTIQLAVDGEKLVGLIKGII